MLIDMVVQRLGRVVEQQSSAGRSGQHHRLVPHSPYKLVRAFRDKRETVVRPLHSEALSTRPTWTEVVDDAEQDIVRKEQARARVCVHRSHVSTVGTTKATGQCKRLCLH